MKHKAPFDSTLGERLANSPLAAKGLTSYRYTGRYGYIMIGARDDADALREAGRSLDKGAPAPTADKLEKWDGQTYKAVTS